MIFNEIILWVLFNILILILLALDLGVFHRKSHVIGIKESLIWSVIWTAVALIFNVWVFLWHGYESAIEFMAGYMVERALSVDNLFVFLMIFTYFQVPLAHQYKVLIWGILVALVMRAFFIITGVALVHNFEWIIYVFGAFLIYSGIKIACCKNEDINPENNILVRVCKKVLPLTRDFVGEKFFVTVGQRTKVTPLFIVLVAVEVTDLIFAMDSIPAVLGVTRDPFIMYTSNIFAILGLRALYFALAGCAQIFHYLSYGITTILVFVGSKMILSDVYPLPAGITLAIIAFILLLSISASILRPNRKDCNDKATKILKQ